MAKYKKVDTDLKFVDREKEVEKFWNEEDIFKKSMENRKEGETYTSVSYTHLDVYKRQSLMRVFWR